MKEIKQFCVVFTEDELKILFEQIPFDNSGNPHDGIYNALANAQKFESLWVDEDELD